MSLPDDAVLPLLRDDFVVGWQNIEKYDYVGDSFGYAGKNCAVGTTNGAGAHNVQIFVLSADGVVLHALFGFWHPEDLARELRLAQALARLWQDDGRTRAEKNDMFGRMQLAAVRQHPPATFARSRWQGFDVQAERRRLQETGQRDTFFGENGQVVTDDNGQPQLKPLNLLVHERMAARPFVKFEDFDVAAFADYGRDFYDNNARVERPGRVFARARATRAKHQRQEQRQAERAAKLAAVRRRAPAPNVARRAR